MMIHAHTPLHRQSMLNVTYTMHITGPAASLADWATRAAATATRTLLALGYALSTHKETHRAAIRLCVRTGDRTDQDRLHEWAVSGSLKCALTLPLLKFK